MNWLEILPIKDLHWQVIWKIMNWAYVLLIF